MSTVHYDIIVTGAVQGVWYRNSTKETALGLGVRGFAMNLPDGSVMIEAEGDRDGLEQLVAWCRIGPPAARVKEVLVREGPLQHHTRFHVRR